MAKNFSIHWFIHGHRNAIVIVCLPDKYIHLSLSLSQANLKTRHDFALINQNRTVSREEDIDFALIRHFCFCLFVIEKRKL